MTETEKAVDAALEEFNGDRAIAAAALGKSEGTLTQTIVRSPELKWKWSMLPGQHPGVSHPPPGQADALHKNPTDTEVALITNLSKEDAMLADGLEKLCLSPEESALALQLQKFHQGHFVQSVQIIGASMTRICLRMATQLDQISKRLDDVRAEMAKCSGAITRSVLAEEERDLLKNYIAIGDQIRRMTDTATRGMSLQAMIRYRLSVRRDKPANPTMSKPGFTPYIPVEGKENGHQNP